MLGSTADDIGVFPEMKEKGEHGGIYKGCINWSLALENSEENRLTFTTSPVPC